MLHTIDAYFAGFFDADGAVMIHRNGKSYNLTVRVNQTTLPVLERLRQEYGGKLQGPYTRSDRHRPAWFWACDAAVAEAFLCAVLPYLIVKRERVELALRFRELFKGEFILPRGPQAHKCAERAAEVLAMRENLYTEMKDLNQRGVPVA